MIFYIKRGNTQGTDKSFLREKSKIYLFYFLEGLLNSGNDCAKVILLKNLLQKTFHVL